MMDGIIYGVTRLPGRNLSGPLNHIVPDESTLTYFMVTAAFNLTPSKTANGFKSQIITKQGSVTNEEFPFSIPDFSVKVTLEIHRNFDQLDLYHATYVVDALTKYVIDPKTNRIISSTLVDWDDSKLQGM